MGKGQPLDHLTLQVRLPFEMEMAIWIVLNWACGERGEETQLLNLVKSNETSTPVSSLTNMLHQIEKDRTGFKHDKVVARCIFDSRNASVWT